MSSSLIECKKQQWARERAEMESLHGPWGLPPPAYRLKHEMSRSRYSSSLEIRDTCPVTAQQILVPRRQRSPSLPPILRFEEEVRPRQEANGGETSGYASDNALHSSPNTIPLETSPHRSRLGSGERSHRLRLGSSTESEGRPRWGDKGVAVGRLWEPQDPDCRLPQMQVKNTPRWVERGLNMIDNGESQILLINHNERSHSPVNMVDHRNTIESNAERNTFLLGQSTPLEPTIKAEREIKRIKALELQAAIIQQLEDREKQKREEKQRRIREEIEEEERFIRQKEIERQRLEEERRHAEEKRQREQKRSEALRLALEKAENDAKQERENRKIKKLRQNFDSMSIRSEDDRRGDFEESCTYQEDFESVQTNNNNGESKMIQNIFIEQSFSPRKNSSNNAYSSAGGQRDSSLVLPNRVPEEVNYIEERKSVASGERNSPVFISPTSMNMVPDGPMSLVPIPAEMFAPMHVTHHSAGMQMAAFLMPQQIYPCIHQPISMQAFYSTETSVQHQRNIMPVHSTTDSFTSTRVLTPTKFRSGRQRDASIQTDITGELLIKMISPDTKTNDEKEAANEQKKDKKQQEDKSNDIELRPKWGVNKPPTQYKKQSEKDLFYSHKRKLKQRKRVQDKMYTSHSSDENKSPSPVRHESQSYINIWTKRNQKQNNSNYTDLTEPDCDKNHVRNNNSQETKRTYSEKKLVPPKRGITLSQKFINDKYGNPQICSPEAENLNNSSNKPDFNSKTNEEIRRSSGKEKNSNKKHNLEISTKVRKEGVAYFKEETEPILLDQLRSLKDNLKRQQKIWGAYEAKYSKKSPSPNNELDLEYE